MLGTFYHLTEIACDPLQIGFFTGQFDHRPTDEISSMQKVFDIDGFSFLVTKNICGQENQCGENTKIDDPAKAQTKGGMA